MVAIIKASGSLRNALHYNENKVNQKVAELIHSRNFGKDTERLGFSDKVRTIEKLTSLNERTRLNTVHISLNFHSSDRVGRIDLQNIADTYMQKIGFGNQPYLVYQHHDSGHPHVHIVTTNIQANGKRISMQNIGRNQSEKARKLIEQEYKLITAGDKTLKPEIESLKMKKVEYGKMETKRAITNVLNAVLPNYKYSSMPELNAVLKSYNVVADRCEKKSRTFRNNGLIYRVLDENQKKVGTPIKASLIYNNPGLKFLQEKFEKNTQEKTQHKARVKNAVDFLFSKNSSMNINQLKDALQKENIHLVIWQNDHGVIYGLTYVDHQTKCVFNGSILGKQYSANAIQRNCKKLVENNQINLPILKEKNIKNVVARDKISTIEIGSKNNSLVDLMRPETNDNLASELRDEEVRKKRKKKLRH